MPRRPEQKPGVWFLGWFVCRNGRAVYLAPQGLYTYDKLDALTFPTRTAARRAVVAVPDRLKDPGFGPLVDSITSRNPAFSPTSTHPGVTHVPLRASPHPARG